MSGFYKAFSVFAIMAALAFPALAQKNNDPAPTQGTSDVFSLERKLAARQIYMDSMDEDGDGKLQLSELLNSIPKKFLNLDIDQNKSISQREYDAFVQKYEELKTPEYGAATVNFVRRLKARFKAMDSDGNGSVTYPEYGAYFKDRYTRFDANGDGVIGVKEYRMDEEKTPYI